MTMRAIGNDGAGNRSRTCDPLITNQMLYQLSYAGNPFDCTTISREPQNLTCSQTSRRKQGSKQSLQPVPHDLNADTDQKERRQAHDNTHDGWP